jgi:hypothetical protein
MKIAQFPFHLFHFRVRQEPNSGMPTDIHELGGQNSEGAVVGWERFVELSHFPANGGKPFNQVNLESHFGQVQRGLHACNASANDKDIPIHERDLLQLLDCLIRYGPKGTNTNQLFSK